MTGPLLVLGASGIIGRTVVDVALDAGRSVIAVARDAAALEGLRVAYPSGALSLVAATVASDADAAALAARVAVLPGAAPEVVVAAIRGERERGRLLDGPADLLRRRLDEDLLPHLFAARHLLPLLAARRHGAYVLVGGPGADHPWAGHGHHSIGAAALRMLARVLHDEARALPVRVQLLSVDAPVRTAANARHACDRWPSADAIARAALRMVDARGLPAPVMVRFPLPAPVPGPTLSDDLDAPERGCVPPAPACLPSSRDLTDARALLRGIAASPHHQDLPR